MVRSRRGGCILTRTEDPRPPDPLLAVGPQRILPGNTASSLPRASPGPRVARAMRCKIEGTHRGDEAGAGPSMDPLLGTPHRRRNPLTGDWVLVSPHRLERPWQGRVEAVPSPRLPAYDPQCYLCPGNTRAHGDRNPAYDGTYVFVNDFPALLPHVGEDNFSRRPAAAGRPSGRRMPRGVLLAPPRSDPAAAPALSRARRGRYLDRAGGGTGCALSRGFRSSRTRAR